MSVKGELSVGVLYFVDIDLGFLPCMPSAMQIKADLELPKQKSGWQGLRAECAGDDWDSHSPGGESEGMIVAVGLSFGRRTDVCF